MNRPCRSPAPRIGPIAWFIITRQDGNTKPIHEYGDFMREVVQDRIERVEGVSEVTIYGGSEREIRVNVRPELLARYRLTVGDVTNSVAPGKCGHQCR